MADSKKRLSITIGLIAVTLFLQFYPIEVFGVEILLAILILSLFIPSILEYRKMKVLTEKNQHLLTHNHELQMKIEQLTKNNLSLENRFSEYKTLIEDLDTFAFTFDLAKNKWSIFPEYDSKTEHDRGNIHEGLYLIEKNVHPEDRMYLTKKTSQWLSGQFTPFEYRTIQPDGEVFWKEMRPFPIKNASDEVERISGISIDISRRKIQEEKLAQMAFYDNLTELPNRLMLKSHLKKVLSRAKRKDHDFAIMFIDLDGFKDVNDTLGHDVGDALLKDVAIRLTSSVREEDLVSRIGGDEFIIVFEETSQDELEVISSRIIQNVGNPYYFSDKEAHVTPSIGIAIYPDHGDEIDSLVDHADTAMYAAKKTGKNTYLIYSSGLQVEQHQEESLIAKFRKWFQK
jgi:diguanylate cyclase